MGKHLRFVLLVSLILVFVNNTGGCPANPAPAMKNTFTVYNTSAQTLTGIYIAPMDAEYWGNNWLNNTTIQPDGHMVFFGLNDGCYYIKAVTAHGTFTANSYCLAGGENINWYISDAKGTDAIESEISVSAKSESEPDQPMLGIDCSTAVGPNNP